MKLVLFVEGQTERKALPAFLKRWLDARTKTRVGIKVVKFEGWRDYSGEIKKKVELNLSGKAGADVVGALGLLDLYGPTIYPTDKHSPDARYSWAKAYFEALVAHSRFRQHFAVHETEAWLLADPAIFPAKLQAALPGRCAQPEQVDFDEPPAKLLCRLYREKLGRRHQKVIDGANLFSRLSPEVAAAVCPRFKALLDDMLAFAEGALP